MKIYKDSFGNTAKIECVEILPYKGASSKEIGYRLWVTNDYEDDFVYFVAVYETFTVAEQKLSQLSAGTFTEAK